MTITATPTATISATPTATTTATATPTVTAVPVTLKIAPKQLNFGKVAVNGAGKTKNVKASNPKGSKKRPGVSVIVENATAPSEFSVTNGCLGSLAAGGKCEIEVLFKPTAIGTATATLMIYDNATGAPQAIPLKGAGK